MTDRQKKELQELKKKSQYEIKNSKNYIHDIMII